jgi:hypothetical protein
MLHRLVLIKALDLCLKIIEDNPSTGLISSKLKTLIEVEDEESFKEFQRECWKRLLLKRNLEQSKSKFITLGSGDRVITLPKYYVLTYNKDWDSNGAAILNINEMPEEVNLKDNPIKNLRIIYDDVDARDRDFDKIQTIMKV